MRLARSTTTSDGHIADEKRSWSLIPNVAVNGTVYVGRPQEVNTLQRADHTTGHFLHQQSAMAYNGAQPTVAELTQDFGNVDKSNTLPTLNRKDHSYCPIHLPSI